MAISKNPPYAELAAISNFSFLRGASHPEELAAAAKIHPKVVRNRIRLAYLSPNLARAILHGDNHVPTLAELNSTVPLGWHEQEGRMQSKSD